MKACTQKKQLLIIRIGVADAKYVGVRVRIAEHEPD